MHEKATAPIIIVAVIIAAALLFVIGRKFMGSGPTNTDKVVYPSFIDPATGKPKAGGGGGTGSGPGAAQAVPGSK